MSSAWVKEYLSVTFDSIEDPRIDRHKKYPLGEIIFLALVGALVGIESWRGLECMGDERLDFLRKFFPYLHGIPSHQTIGRVFSILKPRSFEQFFIAWSSQLHGSNEGKQVAFDGKTVRGARKTEDPESALHLLNAFAVERGIALAQLEVDSKTNEISTLPAVIDSLDLKGSMVSVDALNTQKSIAGKIIDAKADYTLALKANHLNLFDEVKFIFDTKQPDGVFSEPTEKSHGRISSRKYEVFALTSELEVKPDAWKGLKGIGQATVSTFAKNKESIEKRYYLLSYTDAKQFAKASRSHWAIENNLHWVLDVCFHEDASLKRKDHAPRNYSLIRKFALNITRTFKGAMSARIFQIKTVHNADYFESVLRQVGFKMSHSHLIAR